VTQLEESPQSRPECIIYAHHNNANCLHGTLPWFNLSRRHLYRCEKIWIS